MAQPVQVNGDFHKEYEAVIRFLMLMDGVPDAWFATSDGATLQKRLCACTRAGAVPVRLWRSDEFRFMLGMPCLSSAGGVRKPAVLLQERL